MDFDDDFKLEADLSGIEALAAEAHAEAEALRKARGGRRPTLADLLEDGDYRLALAEATSRLRAAAAKAGRRDPAGADALYLDLIAQVTRITETVQAGGS